MLFFMKILWCGACFGQTRVMTNDSDFDGLETYVAFDMCLFSFESN